MVSNIRTQFRAHIDPVCGRVAKYHDQNPDRIANAEKMLKNSASESFQVRRRQDHHRLGAGLLRRSGHAVVFAVVGDTQES
jgi:hypothetical protein